MMERFRRFWRIHRTLFWTVHSVWALATGVAVLLLARERYGFVPWVALFLAATWASTLFFGGVAPRSRSGPPEPGSGNGGPGGPEGLPGLQIEATSYLTRTMYQETLFFLLPFYAYSTVVGSLNVLFTGLLVVLAVLSCLDLVFDRWLRSSPVFSLVFFSVVAFAALNLLLPMLTGLDPALTTRLAALAAVGSGVPLAWKARPAHGLDRVQLVAASAVLLGVGVGVPRLVPPTPLRLENAVFASAVDRQTLEVADTLRSGSTTVEAPDGVFVVLEVFAPGAIPTRARLEWFRDGRSLRTSREVEILAHEEGFRIWDGWRPPAGGVPPGRYRVVVRTGDDRVFGSAGLDLAAPPEPREAKSEAPNPGSGPLIPSPD